MTQRRLAELVGTTEALVSRHATGRVSPGTREPHPLRPGASLWDR